MITPYITHNMCIYIYTYVRPSKLNSCGEVMASLHKAPYRYAQSQHPFHQLGRIAARRGGSRWGIGFLFLLRWISREIQAFTWSPRLTSTASARHQPDSLQVIWPRRLPLACVGLSWLVLPVLPCFRRLFFFTLPPLQPNTTPKWIGKTLTKWTL